MDSDIAEALARVVARLPGDGELRHGQVAMAEAVGRAIEEKRPLVVQAGTGVGKSLGYLVPCVVLGVKTVVATTNRNQPRLMGSNGGRSEAYQDRRNRTRPNRAATTNPDHRTIETPSGVWCLSEVADLSQNAATDQATTRMIRTGRGIRRRMPVSPVTPRPIPRIHGAPGRD